MIEDLKDPNRAVPGWPEYTISPSGEVRRVVGAMGTKAGRVLKWQKLGSGYAKVSLCRGARRVEYLVHRLVAMAYLGDPTGADVCHFDGDKWNNAVSNLRIDTRKGNMADQMRMGKTPRGTKSGSNKYSEADVLAIRVRLDAGESVSSIHNATGIPRPTLYGIRSRQTWGWL